MASRLLLCALLLGCACASWRGGFPVGEDHTACVGDVVLHWDPFEHQPVDAWLQLRTDESFAYRGHAVPAALVQAVHEPLAGQLPADERCSNATRPLVIGLHREAWRAAGIAASSRATAEPRGATPTGLSAPLFDLLVEIVRIDRSIDGVPGAGTTIADEPLAAAAPPLDQLVTNLHIDVWRWDGSTPLEIAAQRTTTERTAAHLAEVAAALRGPLPGFDFESVHILCSTRYSDDCTHLSFVVEGHWRDVRAVLFPTLLRGRLQLEDVNEAGALLSSPLVTSLLEIRGGGRAARSVDDPQYGIGTLLYDGTFQLQLADRGFEVSWSTADSDDLTLALRRLHRWDTIVALGRADEPPPNGPAWKRVARLDRDGRWIPAMSL